MEPTAPVSRNNIPRRAASAAAGCEELIVPWLPNAYRTPSFASASIALGASSPLATSIGCRVTGAPLTPPLA